MIQILDFFSQEFSSEYDTYLSSKIAKLGNNLKATGDFDKSVLMTMIEGANRKSITDCFPLYLFKEHNFNTTQKQ